LSPQQDERLAALITARPDATVAELREVLPTTAALSTLWRRIDQLGFTCVMTKASWRGSCRRKVPLKLFT
jgi:hypothetical protein